MNTLLTIDWDYFMPYIHMMNTSYMENKSNIENNWYKMYLENKYSGRDITKVMHTAHFLSGFWEKINTKFNFDYTKTKLIVSDSHKEAYYAAKEFDCDEVYNIDAHTDLGYGATL